MTLEEWDALERIRASHGPGANSGPSARPPGHYRSEHENVRWAEFRASLVGRQNATPKQHPELPRGDA